MRLSLLVTVGGMLAVFGLQGCQGMRRAEPPRPNPLRPDWSTGELRQHLRFFAGSETEAHATGTSAQLLSAAYVAARMEEFNLQPALANQFRLVYPTRDLDLEGAALFLADTDSTAFLLGTDFLPDGRSSYGALRAEVLTPDPIGHSLEDPGSAVLLPASKATTEHLQKISDEGGRAALIVGPLVPRQVAQRIEGLLIMQVTTATATRITGVSTDTLDAWLGLNEDLESRRDPILLSRPVGVRIDERALPEVEVIAVLSYAPGKQPVLARDLVIVCADLDALGTGAAALLEAARQVGLHSRLWPIPERTILFAVWVGGRDGQSGLPAYLRNPVWPLEKTRTVLYVGLDPTAEPEVQALLDAHGLPLLTVRGDELTPSAVPPGASGTTSDLAASALILAKDLYTQVLQQAVLPEAFFTLHGDTLRIPEVSQ